MTPAAAGRFCLFFTALILPALAQTPQLRIVIVEGEGVLNNVNGRTNRDVVVEVQGANAAPIAGAQVTFTLPAQGASGTFPDGMHSATVATNAQGRASATGIRPNNQTGPMQIRIAATYQGQTATAVLTQTNVAVALAPEPKPTPPPASTSTAEPKPAPAKKGMSKTAKILIVLAIAGGAAAGAAVALSNKGSSSSGGGGGGNGGPPPIVITPGTPGVGGPQ